MKDICRKAASQALGRSLNNAESDSIVKAISSNMRRLAKEDQSAWVAMTPEQQLQAAAQRAGEEIKADAIRKKQIVALKIQKRDTIDNYIKDQKANGLNGFEALKRTLGFVPTGDARTQSIETRTRAIASDYKRQMLHSFETIEPKIFGLFTNKEGIKALTYELFGQDSSKITKPEVSAIAKKGAEEWTKTMETARQHFNNAGGDIGQLEDWRLPQTHDQKRVAKAGETQWVNDTLPMLDRRKYINEDGSTMGDQQLVDFLKGAHETIASGGANKIEPGKITGVGMMANRHAEERSIHFNNADNYLAYQEKYGNPDIYSVMGKHIQSLSKDTAAVEKFGPNPNLMFKYFLDKVQKEESLADKVNSDAHEAQAKDIQGLYDYVAGGSNPIVNKWLARGFDTARQFDTARLLGSTVFSALADNATVHLTAQYNNMSSLRTFRNQLSVLNPLNREELQLARRNGLALRTLTGEVNKWGMDALAANFSKKMASLTMRASGLEALSEGNRRAFGVTMYGSIGSVVKKAESLAGADIQDQRLLKSKGVADNDFQVWKKAELQDWGNGNNTMLTPEAIYKIPDEALKDLGNPSALRREAALKLLGMVDEEINMGVIEPTAINRYNTTAQFKAGTWTGEIAKSTFLFKGMPIAALYNHYKRMSSIGTTGGKARYVAMYLAGTVLCGAAAVQLNNLVSGKNPQDMTGPQFWANALMKGGGLGVYGDFIFNPQAQSGQSILQTLAGPTIGNAVDLFSIAHDNVVKESQNKKTATLSGLAKLIKSNIPLQNLWYTKAVTDRLFFNYIQEQISPGYMNRVQDNARKYGQTYYWNLQHMAPQKEPNVSVAFGQ